MDRPHMRYSMAFLTTSLQNFNRTPFLFDDCKKVLRLKKSFQKLFFRLHADASYFYVAMGVFP